MAEKQVLSGTDLILSIGGKALGFSTDCKIATKTEVGERVTKENGGGKWSEGYVKKYSEDISASGFVLVDGDAATPTYDQLKDMQIAGKPIDLSYNVREGESREGKTSGGYTGKYLITDLELDSKAGEDAKYSVKFKNSGAVTKKDTGLSSAALA